MKRTIERIFPSLVAAVLCGSLLATTTGCNGQTTAAELIATVGTAVATLETLQGNTAMVAQIKADTRAAQLAIQNWKTGTPAQDVLQVLTILQSDINLLPVNPTDQALIQLALGTVEQIVALFPGSAPPVAGAKAVRPVQLGFTVQNKNDFKKQWNLIVSSNPALAGAAIR